MSQERWTVFVGGPFSAALKIENGMVEEFDRPTRAALDRVHAMFSLNGFGLLSSHLAEDFGREIHEATLVQRDNAWLMASDVYVATLPWSGGAPVRSDGTFVEIGLALGLGVPCVLLIENGDDPQWSYYVRNLGNEPSVLILPLDAPEDEIIRRVCEHIAAHSAAVGTRKAVRSAEIDAHVLYALTAGGKAGHTVAAGPFTFDAPPHSLTSRYCCSVERLAAKARQVPVRSALDIGCGIGEITAAFLQRGISVQGYEPDQALLDACSKNLVAAHLSDGFEPISDVAELWTAGVVILQLPPAATGVDPFAQRRQSLLGFAAEALKRLPTETIVWVGFGTTAQIDQSIEMLHYLPLLWSYDDLEMSSAVLKARTIQAPP